MAQNLTCIELWKSSQLCNSSAGMGKSPLWRCEVVQVKRISYRERKEKENELFKRKESKKLRKKWSKKEFHSWGKKAEKHNAEPFLCDRP